MKRNIIFLITVFFMSLPGSMVNAQVLNTEVSLTITSDEFGDGIAAGETGDINIIITNLGPIPISSNFNLGVTAGYNVTQDTELIFEVLNSPTNDANCSYFFSIGDPRPPVDDILYFHSYLINTDIAVGSSYTCTITVTFQEPGELETVWRVFYSVGNNTETISYPFTFRGQALPIPLNTNMILMLLLLLFTAFFLKTKNR